jgi:chemotaxis protein methyltransferase CheR
VSPAADRDAVERFRAVLAQRFGLRFDDGRRDVLAAVLDERLAATGRSLDGWLADLASGAGDGDAVAARLTVGETYFLRHGDQFRAFREVVVPDVLRAKPARRGLRVLSAGCASGEEAYSVAMLTRDLADAGWAVHIRAVDLNPDALARAQCGRCSSWVLRDTPTDVRRAWFRPEGREFVLDPAIREAVRFQQANLLDPDPELWAPASWDVVFCRNVLMYLTAEAATSVVARIASSLVPGGHLFLGHAETLRGLSHDFVLCHTHGAFYYRRRGATRAGARPTTAGTASDAGSAIVAAVDAADSWVEVIRSATERVQRLAEASSAPAPAAVAAAAPAVDLRRALQLLAEERFGEALDAIDALGAPAVADPDVLLLQGVVLVHTGHLARAEEAARRLLAVDDLHAGAHYVLALCREAVGDQAGAVEHDRMAAHLDPGFAMPRLHLGLLARRTGPPDEAREELGRAVALLQGEDASRLLLFGGGFSREALVTLARGELRAVGGTS